MLSDQLKASLYATIITALAKSPHMPKSKKRQSNGPLARDILDAIIRAKYKIKLGDPIDPPSCG